MNPGVVSEKHYTATELAGRWNVSKNTVYRMFVDEPGVLRKLGRAGRVMIRIPESVAAAVHNRPCQSPLKLELSRRNPLGVVRLGCRDAGVSKRSGNVLKRNAA